LQHQNFKLNCVIWYPRTDSLIFPVHPVKCLSKLGIHRARKMLPKVTKYLRTKNQSWRHINARSAYTNIFREESALKRDLFSPRFVLVVNGDAFLTALPVFLAVILTVYSLCLSLLFGDPQVKWILRTHWTYSWKSTMSSSVQSVSKWRAYLSFIKCDAQYQNFLLLFITFFNNESINKNAALTSYISWSRTTCNMDQLRTFTDMH
jgi:hypothetical protein